MALLAAGCATTPPGGSTAPNASTSVAPASAGGPAGSSTVSAGASAPASGGQPGGSAAATSFKLLKQGVLTVATDVSYPPWFIIVPGAFGAPDTATGVDGELVNAFAAEHALKVELLETDFASMLLAVQQGKADLATGLSYKEDRSKQMYFTSAVGSSPVVAYTLKSLDYKGPDSLKGKRIGTGNGYFEADVLEKWQPGNVQLFPNNVTGNQALLNGQIDAWFSDVTSLDNDPFKSNLDKIVANKLKTGDFGFTEEQIYSPVYNSVACGNGALAMALDATLQRLHDSGQWSNILAKYLSGPSLVDLGVKAPPEGCAP
jgi:ABC-type amino acid transport substrate-binding protein